MPTVSVHIPQIGEGLQEARLVAVLKNPGDRVRRDEPIYQMETDKAVMDVESPYEGILLEWLAPVDTILPIGGEVARMEVSDGVEVSAAPSHGVAPVSETPPPVPVIEPPVAAPASSEGGQILSVRIPQIGEGLQEARLVATLKNPGDTVKRDDPIYQMETDKAVMDVESPYEGVLLEWLAPVDTVLAIGAEVARMRVMGEVTEAPAGHGAPPMATSSSMPATPAAHSGAPIGDLRNEFISPRVRSYAREKGLPDEVIARISAPTGRLVETDIDSFLAGGSAASTIAAPPVAPPPAEISWDAPVATPAPAEATPVAKPGPSAGGEYEERALTSKQRLLSSRLMRASQLVVPGTMTVAMSWEAMENLRARFKMRGSDFQPSAFTMFAYACVRALSEFPAFRSTLRGDETLRTYEHVNLGIAVALPGDELVIAVVDRADTMSWKEFAERMREQIKLARDGKDQAHEGVTVSLTNMAHNGIRDAVAVVVPPAVATVFLGESYNGLAPDSLELKIQRCANLGITFDHRLINGVGAADFQNRIKHYVETIGSLITLE